MAEQAFEKNRRSTRSHLLMKATVEIDGVERQVKLRNLSAEGALLEGDDLPPEGTDILFKRQQLCVPARVAWSVDNRMGVAFAQALSPETVLRHIPKPRQRAEVATKRPGLKSPGLSAAERAYAENVIFVRPTQS